MPTPEELKLLDTRIRNMEKHCVSMCQEKNKAKVCPTCPANAAKQGLYKERDRLRKEA